MVQEFDDMVLLAVADGHGDAKHALSDRGSQFAVEIACKIIREALCSIDEKNQSRSSKDFTRFNLWSNCLGMEYSL